MPEAIIIKCRRGSGDKEAEPINDSLITNENLAISRGKRVIDESYYQIRRLTLKVPHKSKLVVPGAFVKITDTKTGLKDSIARVKSYSIEITPRSVFGNLECEIFEEPTS